MSPETEEGQEWTFPWTLWLGPPSTVTSDYGLQTVREVTAVVEATKFMVTC